MPMGMDTTYCTIKVTMDSIMVGPRYSRIMESTFSLKLKDVPQSPVRMPPSQSKYCSKKGRSTPYSSRRAAISASLTFSPSAIMLVTRVSTKSPGGS